MPEVGDHVQVPSRKVGQVPRDGVVMATSGTLLRVRWVDGEESSIMPSMGSVVALGKAKGRLLRLMTDAPAPKGAAKGTSSGKKAAPSKPTGKKASATKKTGATKTATRSDKAVKGSAPGAKGRK
jgi:hypothetical protein